MPLKRHARLAAVVLVVAAILAAALWPEATEVDLTRVDRGPMQVTIDEDGETRVRERFVVSAPVAGRLLRIELEPGDSVVRGTTVVARLVPGEAPLLDARTRTELAAAIEAARAGVAQAQAERDRAAATLDLARSSLQRQERLGEVGVVSRDDLESARTALKTAEGSLRAAESGVARAEYELQLARARLQAPPSSGRTVDVVAPVDGVVLKRLHESEVTVPAGEPLLEIGDPRQLEVVADLLSTDAVQVSAGDPVRIEQWGGGHPLEARVRRIEPSGFMKVSALGVEEQRVNVVIDFEEPALAARALGDGYRVEVRVVIWQEEDVLKVPVGGLFRRGEAWAVFVVENGRARLQLVELGQRNNEEGQILGGLDAGQAIVLHPPDTLADGAEVVERGT
jgi:HlyD family secretion protein